MIARGREGSEALGRSNGGRRRFLAGKWVPKL